MPRIAKADVNRALETAAKTLIRIGGDDGRISREVKNALATDRVPRNQVGLVDIFFKFVDNRDFKAGAQVTPTESSAPSISRACSRKAARLLPRSRSRRARSVVDGAQEARRHALYSVHAMAHDAFKRPPVP